MIVFAYAQTIKTAPPPVRMHAGKALEQIVGASDDRDEEGDDTERPQRPADHNTRGSTSIQSPSASPSQEKRDRGAQGDNPSGGTGGRLPDALWEEIVRDVIPVFVEDELPAVRASAVGRYQYYHRHNR